MQPLRGFGCGVHQDIGLVRHLIQRLQLAVIR